MKKKSGTGIPSCNRTDIGRRTMLRNATILMGAGAAMPSLVAAGNEPGAKASNEAGGPAITARAGTAIVEIESGKIAGAIVRNIYSFKGIPYGATTAGENQGNSILA